MSFKLAFIWFVLAIPSARAWTPPAQPQIREVAREYKIRHPGQPMGIPAPVWDIDPTTIERLAADAQVVVLARLSKVSSYLAPSDNLILTDYALLEVRVLAGAPTPTTARVPGSSTPLTLVVWGGETVVEDVTVVASNQNLEAITDGAEYLLFLRPARTARVAQYEVLEAAIFRTSGNRAVPLFKGAKAAFGFTEAPLSDLIDRIQRAVRR